MSLTPDEVRSSTFDTTRRGYNPADVTAFLEETAKAMTDLEDLNGSAREIKGTELLLSMREAEFGQAKQGLNPAMVDDFIERLMQQIHEHTALPETLARRMSARLSSGSTDSWWRRLLGS